MLKIEAIVWLTLNFTDFSRQAIENERGKVLKENSIIDRNWSSAKLFIVQEYTENANGEVTLIVENVWYF